MIHELYHVSNNCECGQFTIHHLEYGRPDMIFRMQPSRFHIYDLEGGVFSFVMTVEGNKLYFTKRQIEGAEKA